MGVAYALSVALDATFASRLIAKQLILFCKVLCQKKKLEAEMQQVFQQKAAVRFHVCKPMAYVMYALITFLPYP